MGNEGQPMFLHNCKKCRFITTVGAHQPVDVYFCKAHGVMGGSLVVRYNDDNKRGSMSHPMFAVLMQIFLPAAADK